MYMSIRDFVHSDSERTFSSWWVDNFTIEDTDNEHDSSQLLLDPQVVKKRKIIKSRLFNCVIFGLADLLVYFVFMKSYELAVYAMLN